MATKRDEDPGVGSFYNNKSTIIQEARVFNESPISDSFGTQEATNLFFGTTKLFQNRDAALRQMVYLAVKELSTTAEDVIMVTSSIMKDMQGNLDAVYRPNAIRALCRIIDPSMVQGVERFFKAAIVDKAPSIATAALVSSYHLFPVSKDVIKRWVNEAQEALNTKPTSSYFNPISSSGWGSRSQPDQQQVLPSTTFVTQYHALGLLYLIRQQDRMAVTKMIQQFGGGKGGASGTLKNPMALCMLVRYAAKIMEEDPNMQRQILDLLESWLRHKSDMVNFEAARVICEFQAKASTPLPVLTKAVSVLQLFLSSPKPVQKFAAIRTLSALAASYPAAVAACNLDMENLITDSNRSVATYAITTLLKTGNEASVDRLMKQITGFMAEISDEFKVIVVSAVRALCLKFPSKQALMLSFLAGVLRDEGGYEFKRAVVEALFDMVARVAEARDAALAHLCEFIEDCEFTKLSVRILYLLGVEGPKSPQPTKYIRYIYNRVVLENAIVRAAAVSSLAKFGVNAIDVAMRRSVGVLLSRCLDDVDDEVRDRAAMYLKVIEEEELAQTYVKDEGVFSLAALESKLVAYVNDTDAQTESFDASEIPRISKDQAKAESARPSALDATLAINAPKAATPAAAAPSAAETQSNYAEQLAAVPELASYGPVLGSSVKPVQLTESETEYVVACVKHLFKEHVVFQFNVTNTLPDTLLEQVVVTMAPSEETGASFTEDFIIPIPALSAASPSGAVYVSHTRVDASTYSLGSFSCTLKFISKEVDPTSGEPEEDGYEDEYNLEDVEISAGDWIRGSFVVFASEWERLGHESVETFSLGAMDSIKAACDSLIEILGMEPLGGTENPTSKSVHTLQLSGFVVGGGGKVLARCRMTYAAGDGVTLELGVRAEKEEAARLVVGAIGG
ncbi:Coatomer subunit delta [Rhizoctonia solani]|uniref:Coatomer subunit gamma n=1 Tax=Rhizoctonia solani TaxID=456999 RepID=A0A8H7HDJ7_9AGAM|nr:Coatomer subunit delta [Rhizoctonia solani]